MNRLAYFALAALLSACGGANSKNTESKTAPGPGDPPETTPIWEKDVGDSAYEFYRSVSRTLLRTNQPLKASRTIGQLIKLKPKEPEPYHLMGRAYTLMSDYDSAIAMFDKAIERDDEYAAAHSMKGVVLNLMNDHANAEKSHKKAIELDGESAVFYNNLGFCYYLMGQYEKAIKAYRDALERDPGSKRIHNNLGFSYGKQAKFEMAYRHFKLAGLPAQASNNMGFVHESRGEREKAYEYYKLALEQDPMLIQAQKNLERVCVELGRPMPDVGLQYNSAEEKNDGTETPTSESPPDASPET